MRNVAVAKMLTLCEFIGKSFVSRSRTINTKALTAIRLGSDKEQNKILPDVPKNSITLNTLTWMIMLNCTIIESLLNGFVQNIH